MSLGRFLILAGGLAWLVLGLFHPGWKIDLVWVGAGLIAIGWSLDGVGPVAPRLALDMDSPCP